MSNPIALLYPSSPSSNHYLSGHSFETFLPTLNIRHCIKTRSSIIDIRYMTYNFFRSLQRVRRGSREESTSPNNEGSRVYSPKKEQILYVCILEHFYSRRCWNELSGGSLVDPLRISRSPDIFLPLPFGC